MGVVSRNHRYVAMPTQPRAAAAKRRMHNAVQMHSRLRFRMPHTPKRKAMTWTPAQPKRRMEAARGRSPNDSYARAASPVHHTREGCRMRACHRGALRCAVACVVAERVYVCVCTCVCVRVCVCATGGHSRSRGVPCKIVGGLRLRRYAPLWREQGAGVWPAAAQAAVAVGRNEVGSHPIYLSVKEAPGNRPS